MDEDFQSPSPTPAPESKPPISNGMIIIIVLVIVALGYGFYYWYTNYFNNTEMIEAQPTSHLTEDPNPLSTVTSTKSFEQIESEIVVLDDNNSLPYKNTLYSYSINYPKNWNISSNDPNAEAVDFASATDMQNGVVISTSLAEANTDSTSIEEWVANQPVGDPEGANASENTEFIENEDYSTMFAKTTTPEYDLITYHWICNGNVMSLSYMSSDFEGYQNYLQAMLQTLVPCSN